MNHQRKARKLINEGFACSGMMAEVKSKCLLLKQRVKTLRHTSPCDFEEQEAQIHSSILQMRKDLARYSRRIKEICEELGDYGIVLKLE